MNRGVIFIATTLGVVVIGLLVAPLLTLRTAPAEGGGADAGPTESAEHPRRSLLDERRRRDPVGGIGGVAGTSTAARPSGGQAPRPEEDVDAPDYGAALTGLGLTDATADELKRMKVPEGMTGVMVKAVDPGSPAAEAALQRGDVIVRAQRDKISSAESLRTAVGARSYTLLTVYRDGYPFQVVLHRPFKGEAPPAASEARRAGEGANAVGPVAPGRAPQDSSPRDARERGAAPSR